MLVDGASSLIWEADQKPRPKVIVFGNEKGGVGKTTLAMHIAVALATEGRKVATIDTDGRQGSLSRYLDNRAQRLQSHSERLPGPSEHMRLQDPADGDAYAQLADTFENAKQHDYLIVDTPGTLNATAQIAHANADVIVTPVNDSFMDLDALAEIDFVRRVATAPSAYTKAVWKQNNLRVVAGHAPARWLVVRNRMSPINARNKKDISDLLQVLSARIGFHTVAGISERLVFRELFYAGLTVIDLTGAERRSALTASQQKAAEEIRSILAAITQAPRPARPPAHVMA